MLSADARAGAEGFAERSHRPRTIGLALAMLMVGAALHEAQVAAWLWAGPLLHCFIGPHLALWLARRSRDPRAAERRNLLADHLLAGVWTALAGFNLLPSVAGLGLLGMNTMAGGGLRLLARGLLLHALGITIGIALFGWRWHPGTSMSTMLACVPILLVQPLVIGHTAMAALARLKRQHVELEHSSRHDGLSGLFNRAHWEALVEAEFQRFLRTGEPATLVLADLDHFKRINDELGHAAGDAVIVRFARMLRRELREIDAPGRYGGEEFGILLPHTGAAQAREVVERLRARLHAQPLIEGQLVTASFGIATLTQEIGHRDAWVRQADQMLYRAKHRGRDRLAIPGDETLQGLRVSDLRGAALQAFSALQRQAGISTRLLAALDRTPSPMALFDPADRLTAANPAFVSAFALQPDARSFADLIRDGHRRGLGLVVQTDDIDAWLRAADGRRRTQPYRSYAIELADGRSLWAEETALCDGWLLFSASEQEPAAPPALQPRSSAEAAIA